MAVLTKIEVQGCVFLIFKNREIIVKHLSCRKNSLKKKQTHIPQFLISQKPAIHQFAEASYLDQHGVCLNMVALDKVMEWQAHTGAVRRSPHLIKPHNDITQAFRLLIAAVGKSLSRSVSLSFPSLSHCSPFIKASLSFLPFICAVSPLGRPVAVELCERPWEYARADRASRQ